MLEAVFDNERVLKFGSNAPEAIAKVQQALIDAGFAIPNGPTGGFGPQTKAAVIAFQKAAGLEQRQVDGIIGPNTMSRLDSRFPTAEAPAPSTNCEQGFKTVTVDIVSLRDASGDPLGDLAFANDVFRQCCVQFVLGTATTVSPELSDRFLGGDTDLQMAGCGNVAQEELDTFLGATAEFGLSSRIKVFYVASMTPSNQGTSAAPLCATGPRAPLRDMVVVMNGHNRRTLAHEFGHILMNTFAVTAWFPTIFCTLVEGRRASGWSLSSAPSFFRRHDPGECSPRSPSAAEPQPNFGISHAKAQSAQRSDTEDSPRSREGHEGEEICRVRRAHRGVRASRATSQE